MFRENRKEGARLVEGRQYVAPDGWTQVWKKSLCAWLGARRRFWKLEEWSYQESFQMKLSRRNWELRFRKQYEHQNHRDLQYNNSSLLLIFFSFLFNHWKPAHNDKVTVHSENKPQYIYAESKLGRSLWQTWSERWGQWPLDDSHTDSIPIKTNAKHLLKEAITLLFF